MNQEKNQAKGTLSPSVIVLSKARPGDSHRNPSSWKVKAGRLLVFEPRLDYIVKFKPD